MRNIKFVLIAVSFALASCGYTPVHGVKSKNSAPGQFSVLTAVSLTSVKEGTKVRDTRVAQRVENELLDLLPPAGSKTTSLAVTVNRSVGNQTLQQDTSVTRKVLNLSAQITLRNLETGVVVLQNSVLSSASFNTPRDPYATLIAEQDAESRAAKILAENIITQVSVFLGR